MELRDPLRLPSLSLCTWHWFDGQVWIPRPAIKCSEVDPEQPQLSTPQLSTPATRLPPPARLPDPAAVTPQRHPGVPLEHEDTVLNTGADANADHNNNNADAISLAWDNDVDDVRTISTNHAQLTNV